VTNGPVGLVGGLEHYEATMPIDRRVLDEVGVFAPEVVILPLASFRRHAAAAGALAHQQWTRLGASARVVHPASGWDPAAVDAVSEADVIVLPGGVPNRLMAALGSSPVLDQIVTRWRAGAGVTGSSAGAILLFEQRIRLYPPNPFQLTPGFGLLQGYIAAPHFDRLRVARWFSPIIDSLGGLGVIGLDESTGLVGRDGSMQVLGSGSVTIATGSGIDIHPAGSTVDLQLSVPDPSTRLSSRSSPPPRLPAGAASSLRS